MKKSKKFKYMFFEASMFLSFFLSGFLIIRSPLLSMFLILNGLIMLGEIFYMVKEYNIVPFWNSIRNKLI